MSQPATAPLVLAGAVARRFEAVILHWESVCGPDGRGTAVRPLVELIAEAGRWAIPVGITAAPEDRARLLDDLWGQGIAPAQVLVIVGEPADAPHLPGAEAPSPTVASVCENPATALPDVAWIGGGLDGCRMLLRDQIARRRRGEPPMPDDDPRWTLTITGADPLLERVHESQLAFGDGEMVTRGSLVTGHARGRPGVLLSGVYTGAGSRTHLLAAPRWHSVSVPAEAAVVGRRLDLRTGVLYQHLRPGAEAVLFCSAAAPTTAVLRVHDRAGSVGASRPLTAPTASSESGVRDGCFWMRVTGRPGTVVAAAHQRLAAGRDHAGRVLDRVACYGACADGPASEVGAVARARRAADVGFDRLLADHRAAWARRWEDADVRIDGDPELERAVRFAMFQLQANAPRHGEAAIGARGLTGDGYRGHVFWDTDVYVHACLVAIAPHAARAVLEYRRRRLPVALRSARHLGRAGARFPWESAASGRDVTPRSATTGRGEHVEILTGTREEHIVADVAWAAASYVDWTGDLAFAHGPGRDLLVATARWWASRIETDAGGRGHIRGVIGPDEYHDCVDDNAYTNVMARWNLRRAAGAAGSAVDRAEQRHWLALAEELVDGYDPATGIYEQFAGYGRLEPLLIDDVAARRPVAADVVLGHERTVGSQLIKQADVLMLHYLIPEAVAPGSLTPNLDFYDPRTAHGSTLSPGVHAALHARAGRLAQAIEMLRLTARIDLDDLGGTTGGGLHMAAMASTWRALAFGFTGLRPVGDALAIDPRLPEQWDALELRMRFRGSRVRLRVQAGSTRASADPPVDVLAPGGERVRLTARAQRIEHQETLG